MYASMILYTLVALNGIMASPVQELEVEPRAIGPRTPSVADIPFPKMPVRNKASNAMGSHTCSNTTACDQTIICCNNNNGFQICIGELDFNMPITINVYE
ncbi:hypothetical protein MKX08_002393 [Trichoderma sp. CBMAI-0020]|nr:hypothetical protein MKX08_002393 [Trichoderma sp. CBMAI-0020]